MAYQSGIVGVGETNPYNRGNFADIHTWDMKS